MDNMQLDKTISFGNIVSWVMIIAGLAVGYGKLASATLQNAKDTQDAKDISTRVENASRQADAARSSQIMQLTVDVAVTKSTMESMKTSVVSIEKKIDEFITEVRRDKRE